MLFRLRLCDKILSIKILSLRREGNGMAWCPKCKNEYREGITVCAECGCELVEEKELYNRKPLLLGEEQQLQTLKSFLEYNGIKTAEIRYVEQEAGYELLVKDTDFTQALKVVRVFMEQKALEKIQEMQENGTMEEMKASAENTEKEAGETQPVQPYVNSAEQAEENRSSAWTLLIVGSLGLIAMILGIVGVIPLNLGNPYMFYGVMSAVFILFIVMGAVSMKNAKIFAKKAESENSLRDSLLKWCEENLTAEKIDAQIENADDVADEILYFRRYEMIKKMMNHQFMNLDQGFLEQLIDDEVYDMVFSEE